MTDARLKRKIPKFFNILVCLTVCLIWLAPFGWLLSTSMRPRSEAFRLPPAFIPERLIFTNYTHVFQAIPIIQFAANSLFIALTATLLMLLVTSLACYSITRIDFLGKKIVMPVLLSGLMIPSSVILIPLFFTIRDMGLINNRWSVILTSVYFPMAFLLLRSFYLTIPRSYDEAAYIDGAGHLRIFFQIILPMSKSSMIVSGLLCFITSWNNYLVPLVLLTDSHQFTLPLGIQFLRNSQSTDISLILAGVTLVLIPPVILFITCQRWLIQGMVTTGIKS